MFQTVAEWWAAVTAWFTGSDPQGEKELIEQRLETLEVRALWDIQESHLRGGRGRYGQVLKGGGKPSDRARDFGSLLNLPGNVDWWIDEYEGPDGKGWILRAELIQGFTRSTLSIDSRAGSLGWVDVDTRLVP